MDKNELKDWRSWLQIISMHKIYIQELISWIILLYSLKMGNENIAVTRVGLKFGTPGQSHIILPSSQSKATVFLELFTPNRTVSSCPQKVQSRGQPEYGYILAESSEAAWLNTLLFSLTEIRASYHHLMPKQFRICFPFFTHTFRLFDTKKCSRY